MEFWKNILDENVLKANVNFAALFVLNFKCLKEFAVEQVRGFYAEHLYMDGNQSASGESEEYKRKVRKLDPQIDNASLKWFVEAGAITQGDYATYQLIRKRRNEITHELLRHLSAGFDEKDIQLFVEMINIYRKMDRWWINEIEIPTSPDNIPDDYDKEGVCGSQAIVLSIINDIVLGNEAERYKDVMETLAMMSVETPNVPRNPKSIDDI